MKSIHLSLPLITTLFFLAGKSTASEITLGSTLTTKNSSSSWISPNKSFSLKFISDSQNPSQFLAAITYLNTIPIWSAGSVGSGGFLQLQFDGNFRLSDSSGASVWESGTANRGVISASLDESGNLKLFNGSNFIVWQSFENPKDTILESQNFTFGKVLRSGAYSFTVLQTGNLTLKWNNSVEYFNKGLNISFNSKKLESPVLMLQNDGILSLSDSSLPSSVIISYSSNYGDSGDVLRFVRLDKDGNLRAYGVPRGSNKAISRWSAVEDQCDVFGWCGRFGICSYNDSAPVCGCPSENFTPVDMNDSTLGCKLKVQIQDCPQNSTMLQLNNTQFLTYPPELSNEQFYLPLTACRQNCLTGGACVASTALADGSGLCHLKFSNFVSGYQSSALPSTSFVKVCGQAEPFVPFSGLTQSRTSSSKFKIWVVMVVVVGTIVGMLLIEVVFCWLFCLNSPKFRQSSKQYALLEYSGAPVQFSYKELQRTTKGFKEKLGGGGFGAMYKGVLANKAVVAVKQLEGIEQGEKQFRMEVATIRSTRHLNLVRLIGFCSEGRHRLLVKWIFG